MKTGQHDHHLVPFLKARFGLTVTPCTAEPVWIVCKGDYDLDVPYAYDYTVFGAALDYGMCHDGELFDTLCAIELGQGA